MLQQPSILIRPADVDQILDLRWRILRAGLARETANFDGDREPTTHHVVAEEGGNVVGCVTILRRPWENQPAWQLRGMAVEPRLQGSGIGRRLVEKVAEVARAESFSDQFWCNARTPAVGFYETLGWVRVGEEFVIPTAGPHWKMKWKLK